MFGIGGGGEKMFWTLHHKILGGGGNDTFAPPLSFLGAIENIKLAELMLFPSNYLGGGRAFPFPISFSIYWGGGGGEYTLSLPRYLLWGGGGGIAAIAPSGSAPLLIVMQLFTENLIIIGI